VEIVFEAVAEAFENLGELRVCFYGKVYQAPRNLLAAAA
jgi:hypothetical protein